MDDNLIVSGVILEEASLTVDELAVACSVDTAWIVERVEAGLLCSFTSTRETWRFASREVVRARRMLAMERDMDANPELAALVADLIEELQRLRAQVAGTR